MHFCVLATRGHGAFSWPRKYGLNWFIPAFVKSSVGSSCGTTGELGTNVWPCFWTKKSMNCWRISWEVIAGASSGDGSKTSNYYRPEGDGQGRLRKGLGIEGSRD